MLPVVDQWSERIVRDAVGEAMKIPESRWIPFPPIYPVNNKLAENPPQDVSYRAREGEYEFCISKSISGNSAYLFEFALNDRVYPREISGAGKSDNMEDKRIASLIERVHKRMLC